MTMNIDFDCSLSDSGSSITGGLTHNADQGRRLDSGIDQFLPVRRNVLHNSRRPGSAGLHRWIFLIVLALMVGLLPIPSRATPSTSAKPEHPPSAMPRQPVPPKSDPGTSPGQGASSATLSLGDATIRIPTGSRNAVVQVMMKAENLSKEILEKAKAPSMVDLGGVGAVNSTKVEFDNPVEIDKSLTSRAWLWTVHVVGLSPNSSQNRNLRLTYGEVSKYVGYVLTNVSPQNFTWSVSAPISPWVVWFGILDSRDSTSVVVTTGDYPATNIRLAQASLKNGSGTSQIGLEDLKLCGDPSCSDDKINVNARSVKTLYIRLKESPGQSFTQNGKYTGTLSFAVDERPELQTVNVTLDSSSLLVTLLGVVLIALGIYLAWWIGARAHARLLRLEALKPVAVLLESIVALLRDLERVQTKIGQQIPGDGKNGIEKILDKIKQSLTVPELEANDRLPPSIPRPFSGGTDTSANLKAFLADKGKRVDGMSVLVRDGIDTVMEDWKAPFTHKDAIITALTALNEKADSVTDRSTGEQAVREVLQQYNMNIMRQFDAAGPGVITPPATQTITWEIGQIYAKVWLIWGILTFLGGLAALILTRPGFGTPVDLIFCFFWGFGLPTGIEKLQQLSPGGVATSIGIAQFKAKP